MNTSTSNKFFAAYLLAIVGLFASVGYELAKPEAVAPQEVVKLERVVILGKRAEMQAAAQVAAQLPRVVITGKRDVHADDVQVASL